MIARQALTATSGPVACCVLMARVFNVSLRLVNNALLKHGRCVALFANVARVQTGVLTHKRTSLLRCPHRAAHLAAPSSPHDLAAGAVRSLFSNSK